MANDSLRAALEHAGLAPDDLAQIVPVDVRTVRRWLSGGTPYPRQRSKVARALDATEHELWPDIATQLPASGPPAARTRDVLAGYPEVGDPDVPDRNELMHDATDRIDLLGATLMTILDTPGVPELLRTKAAHGCSIRILTYDTGPHLVPLLNEPGIEIRLLKWPSVYLIDRFDEDLLLTLHMVAGDFEHMPVIYLHRATPDGIFDRLIEYYDDLWEKDSQPLGPRLDLPAREDGDDDEHPESSPSLPAGEQPAAGDRKGSVSSPRRWPRRPDGPPDYR